MARTGRPKIERVEVECAGCGAKLLRRETDILRNRTGRFFCGKECLNRVGSKPRRGVELFCAMCGEKFYPRYGEQRCCSRSCADKYQRKDRIEFSCERCGEKFSVRPSMLKFNANRFCSRSCMQAFRKEQAVGRRKTTPDGYVIERQPDHPDAQGAGWIMVHRLVMEEMMGRRLDSDESVHHKNGVRDDNRPENLELWITPRQRPGQRVEDIVAHAVEMLRRYAPERLA